MLLTITTTHRPATDLGYLLYKHPQKLQSVELAAGKAHVFYPEATEDRCTVALLLDIDPVALVRSGKFSAGGNFALEQYVNDRPYAASSFLSTAIAAAFSTAMNGTCRDKPELPETTLPFEATLTAVPARGGESLIRRLFEPLGYAVELTQHHLDANFPDWGMSRYFNLTLRHHLRLRELLSHLYVLVPVLANDKHYFVGSHEVEKLLDKGKDWLPAHPEKELLTRRYLKNLGHLTRQAFDVLMREEADAEISEDDDEGLETKARAAREKRVSLHQQRLETVFAKLQASGAKRVLDLGCGEGKLLRMLLKDKQFEEIVGMDVSHRSLEIAAQRLGLDRLPEAQRQRLTLLQGSLTYRDKRLTGFDAAALVEVIEHLDPNRLHALEAAVFGFAKPRTVVVTTPNAEYNRKYESLAAGQFRHSDHRFEWTRPEFESWAMQTAATFGYETGFFTVGEVDAEVGASSQGAVFNRGTI